MTKRLLAAVLAVLSTVATLPARTGRTLRALADGMTRSESPRSAMRRRRAGTVATTQPPASRDRHDSGWHCIGPLRGSRHHHAAVEQAIGGGDPSPAARSGGARS